jgi:hypothetical protein
VPPDSAARGRPLIDMKKLAVTLVVLYILSQAFDSVARWVLDKAGLGALIYARDFGLALAIFLFCALLARDRKDVVRTFWLLICFALGMCVALASGLGVPQILFGLKVWLPFVCAFLLVETGAAAQLDAPRAWCALWAILCAGVFVNYFYRFPWIGLTVQIGDADISANREWTALGVQRLSGFSRTSVDAATIILLLYIYLVVTLKGAVSRIAVILVSGAAIMLTTSKGAAGAFFGSVLLLPMLTLARSSAPRLKGVLASGLIAIAAIGAIAPLVSVQIPFPRLKAGTTESWLFGSLLARAWDTWPAALDLLSSQWQLVSGRGIGGIGAAQGLFEAARMNTADNLFVYLYVTAGVFGAALYGFYACASFRLQLAKPAHRMAYLVLFSVLGYGLTANIIESATFALALGGLLSMLSFSKESSSVVSMSMHSA